MNERIEKLALQAGAVNVWEWASDDVLDTKNMDAKKFAELIVQECVKVAMRSVGDDEPKEAWYLIKEHFGVE
jgi:hypothetical protein